MLGQDNVAAQLIKICRCRFQIPVPACLCPPHAPFRNTPQPSHMCTMKTKVRSLTCAASVYHEVEKSRQLAVSLRGFGKFVNEDARPECEASTCTRMHPCHPVMPHLHFLRVNRYFVMCVINCRILYSAQGAFWLLFFAFCALFKVNWIVFSFFRFSIETRGKRSLLRALWDLTNYHRGKAMVSTITNRSTGSIAILLFIIIKMFWQQK